MTKISECRKNQLQFHLMATCSAWLFCFGQCFWCSAAPLVGLDTNQWYHQGNQLQIEWERVHLVHISSFKLQFDLISQSRKTCLRNEKPLVSKPTWCYNGSSDKRLSCFNNVLSAGPVYRVVDDDLFSSVMLNGLGTMNSNLGGSEKKLLSLRQA